MPDSVWMTMPTEDREKFIDNFLKSTEVAELFEDDTGDSDKSIQTSDDLNDTVPFNETPDTNEDPLLLLAAAASSVQHITEYPLPHQPSSSTSNPCNKGEMPSGEELQISFLDFQAYFEKQPVSLLKMMYRKATELKNNPQSISLAPGCSEGSVMVQSSSKKDRPHLILRGKTPGSFKCEK